MKGRIFNWGLLLTASSLLLLGFLFPAAWFVAGIIGLIPAINWFISDLRRKEMGSDVLAILSITGALMTDELLAAAVISLMLASGRVLESWAEGQAERQLKSLINRMPRSVHRVTNSGALEEISVERIAIGDILLIRSGEVTATDGILNEVATLDESALTGEPLPITRSKGDEVFSGIVNAGAPFTITARTSAAASTYSGIVKLVASAQKKSAPGIRLANAWALRFVPLAILMAGGAWLISGDVKRAIAVLVIATPCPLILAVPIAIVAGLSQAAKRGVIIKGGAILELLAKTDSVLLDKTGTLTHGGPKISHMNTSLGVTENQVLQLAASIDQFSPHIVAKALVSEAKSRRLDLYPATDITEVAGHHIAGLVGGQRIQVGQLSTMPPTWLTFNCPLMVSVESDGQLIGVLGLEDPIRPESREMVSALRRAGVSHIALVTGDREETAQEVATAVGITEVYAKVSAAGKLEIARQAKVRSAGSVVVVGDGINDAPALAAADVGVAMGARGASAASEAADVVIVEDSIDRLTHAIRIAKTSRSKALQAAAIGMGLALFGMFLGAFGILSPSQGAVVQEFIDVIAILWALTALRS